MLNNQELSSVFHFSLEVSFQDRVIPTENQWLLLYGVGVPDLDFNTWIPTGRRQQLILGLFSLHGLPHGPREGSIDAFCLQTVESPEHALYMRIAILSLNHIPQPKLRKGNS